MKLILASNSPRRKELLEKLNYEFITAPSQCEEISTAETAKDKCLEIACRKAMDVFERNTEDVVIGCDTVVEIDGKLLGKPKTVAEAKEMLGELSGKTHSVHTGACVASPSGIWTFAETSLVTFKMLSGEVIDAYVKSGSPFDKAGGYGIQDSGFVENIEGNYDNVMGFPSNRIDRILKLIFKR